jgi:hypothetical protein
MTRNGNSIRLQPDSFVANPDGESYRPAQTCGKGRCPLDSRCAPFVGWPVFGPQPEATPPAFLLYSQLDLYTLPAPAGLVVFVTKLKSGPSRSKLTPPQLPHPDLPSLRRDQLPQTIRVVNANTFPVCNHLPHVLRAMLIVLQRRCRRSSTRPRPASTINTELGSGTMVQKLWG